MNMTKSKYMCGALLGLLAFLQSASAAQEPTALELIKLGNDYVGKDARDKVVQIRSEKSVGSLTPAVWYVVYYDEDATFKATEVKFGAGKKMKVSRPARVLEMAGDHKQLDLSKVKTDSDAAIKIACDEPLAKKVDVKATQLWLQRGDSGPVWKVRLWAAKLKRPTSNANIGEVYVSAEDGKVVRTDLHINSVD